MNPAFRQGALLSALIAMPWGPGEVLAQQTVTTLSLPSRPKVELRLIEERRIGTREGEHDAFGFIRDAILDRRGRLLVADAQAHTVIMFDSSGSFLGFLGRVGEGPGELQTPWALALDQSDSLFVFDAGLARVSVYDPGRRFARDFRLSPAWNVNDITFLPDDRLLVSAFGVGEEYVLHEVSRDGDVVRSFGPRPRADGVYGFAGSLLGGSIDFQSRVLVYSNKSPYEILIGDASGAVRHRCLGSPSWTTTPRDVVEVTERFQRLHWNQYVHSSKVIALNDHLFLNVILDLPKKRTLLDVVSISCDLLARVQLPEQTVLTHARGDRVVGVVEGEFPQVLVYRVHLQPRSPNE